MDYFSRNSMSLCSSNDGVLRFENEANAISLPASEKRENGAFLGKRWVGQT